LVIVNDAGVEMVHGLIHLLLAPAGCSMPLPMVSVILLALEIPEWLPYVAAVVAIVAAIWGISVYYERKRSEALAAVAAQLGLTFSAKDQQQAPLQMQTALFQKGHGKEFRNIMTGSAGGLRVVLFDYKFTVGSGKYSHTYRQTVAAYTKNGVQLPVLEIRQRGLWRKIFSGKGLRFDSDPEFARRMYVHCADEMRAQSIFTPALLSFLGQLDPGKKWRFEGQGDTLLVYRSEKKVKPPDFRNFLDETSSLANQFFTQGNCRG
jgi:hypothetical protein